MLSLWAAFGLAVIGYLGWIRPARTAGRRRAETQPAAASASAKPATVPHGRAILIALGICAVMQCLFSFTYMDASHPQGPVTSDTEAEAAAMTVPIGAAP